MAADVFMWQIRSQIDFCGFVLSHSPSCLLNLEVFVFGKIWHLMYTAGTYYITCVMQNGLIL